jgi:predicted nucleic acid-binding protein
MRSKATRFAILDTSLYIDNFRTGRFTFRLLQSSFIVRCSSVVLHELLRGARTALERKFVMELGKRCQVLTPTEQHWSHAADILSRIRRGEHYEASKIRELAFDVLIALSARSIGASVITSNRHDFQTIQRYLPFHLICWE